jgi:hypothetical protein
VFDANGVLKQQFVPFRGHTGGVNVAIGEVTGNATSRVELLNPGGAAYAANGLTTIKTYFPHGFSVGQTVRINIPGAAGVFYNGDFTITKVTSTTSFEYFNFIRPAMAPATADGGTASVYQKDIIVSTGAGSTGRVAVYEYIGNQLRLKSTFAPFGPNYKGGIQITTGDVTGNFHKEIIVGKQTGGSNVKVYGAVPGTAGSQYQAMRAFLAFAPAYTGGVTLAATNIDETTNDPLGGDPYDYNYAEIVVGRAQGAPVLAIFDAQQAPVFARARYFAFDENIRTGINVAAGDTDGIRGGNIYVSLKNSTNVTVLSGQTGVSVGSFRVPYSATYGRNLDIAINDLGDRPGPDGNDFGSYTSLVSDLFVVASDGPLTQVPVIFRGRFSSPAGLNGSRRAP